MSTRDFAEKLALESSQRRIWSQKKPKRGIPASKFAHTAPGVPLAAAPVVVAIDRPTPSPQDEANLDLAEAIDQVNDVLDRLEDRRATYKAQIAALKRRDECAANRIEHILDQVLTKMLAAGVDRANGLNRWFETKQTPPKLEVDNESEIPDAFMRETITSAPDKNAIKAVLLKALGNRATPAELAAAEPFLVCCRLTQSTTVVRH